MNNKNTVMMHNHQKGFKHIIETIYEKLTQDGIKVTLQKIAKNLYYKIKGIDFSMQELHNLDIKSLHKNHATICGSSSEETMHEVLKTIITLDDDITKGVFVDIGSGKGKLLARASRHGFKELIGVEFSKTLSSISRKNLQKLHIQNVTIYTEDATNFILPPHTKVIYLLNPFDDIVMEKFLIHILKQRHTFAYDIYLIYRAPVFAQLFTKFKDFVHVQTHEHKGDKTEFYLLKKKRDLHA